MSRSSPRSPLAVNHDLSAAPDTTTPPDASGASVSPPSEELQGAPSSPKGPILRVMEKTVDKLGKSWTAKATQSLGSLQTSPRRVLSLSRASKGKERGTVGGSDGTSTPVSSQRRRFSSSESPPKPSPPPATDDSPFIRPLSPSPTSSRPSLQAFRGDGSMRAGTQTLIQALQAIPWSSDPDNDDEIVHPDLTSTDSESDSEDSSEELVASSIHTIYRPVARSRRADNHLSATTPHSTPIINYQAYSPSISAVDGAEVEDSLHSNEDVEPDEDFDATPHLSMHEHTQPSPASATSMRKGRRKTLAHPRLSLNRVGSTLTVRVQRRAHLAEKLKEIFELDGITEVREEMPCWLLRSILLQGYMYLTNTYLCFFAHMPMKGDQILKSGSLNKKASRTKRWMKRWFVLKNDALSWYQSSSDPYFPHGIADLRYAISCEPVGEKEFRLRTNQKTISLAADSVPSRDEWVKALRKVIFKAQNMGDSVKIAIPYSAILEVEKSSAMDFSETIDVKVFDREEPFSVDSYFFAYFHDLQHALNLIRDAVRTYRALNTQASPDLVRDTTHSRVPHTAMHAEIVRSASAPEPEAVSRNFTSAATPTSTSGFSLTSLWKPFHDSYTAIRSTPATQTDPDTEDFTHISKRASFIPSAFSSREDSPSSLSEAPKTSDSSTRPGQAAPHTYSDHTYPPPTSPADHVIASGDSASGSGWGVGVPSWLRGPSKRVFSSPLGSGNVGLESAGPSTNSEMIQAGSGGHLHTQSDLGFSMLETPDSRIDPEIHERFSTSFAFDEREMLLGYFPGYIFRLLPLYGRLYISTNYFSFRSSGTLTAKTWMILPIRDILSLETSKATRFGHYGLVVVVKGYEELFFEFGARDRRTAFVALLEHQMEDVRKRISVADTQAQSQGKREALDLEELECPSPHTTDADPIPENMTDSLPAVMFTSGSSTFLVFKPKESLRFTFLTIGSRGDVQPYIALAKGLQADGHRVKIATHVEFKDWIESHGIEYGYVGGDPAELMRICVENGAFTVAFMKEGLLKFRGWLDDLLKTSWDACRDTDVLIESPSAMAGYHIAEALGIPYFRAFTMTWTRTRAYPHAFAVPERKMGGGYNYMSYVMFDQVFWRAISGQINRWRRNVLHLPATSLDKMEPHKIPFLYNFSPSIVPPPLDWPEWIRVTGYWFLDEGVNDKKWQPPADVVEFIDTARKLGKKIVYIGFGSIIVSDPKSMTRCVVEAIVESGVHAILSKGWSDRLQVKIAAEAELEEPLPKEILSISSIPHDWLFQRIDAACHHGGAGTTGASLRAGIPTIIKPFFGDQFFWADRVEAMGVGSGVRKLTVEHLRDALITATTDRKQIERAKLIGEHIRAENGVATAIECIYRDLDYARSLVKRHTNEGPEEEGEGATVRNRGIHCPRSRTSAPSEDWSVVSDQEDYRSSGGSRHSEGGPPEPSPGFKRTGLTAAVLAVLPDVLTPASSSPHRSKSLSRA